MTLAQLLELANEAETLEQAFPVLEDPALCSLLSVWGAVCPLLDPELEFDSLPDAWAALDLDLELLAEAASLPPVVANSKLRQALALALVRPDGSIHRFARFALRAKVRESLKLEPEVEP